jgi:hypothetical protein
MGNPKNTTGMKIFVYEASRRSLIELCGNKVAVNKQAPLIIPNIEAIIIRIKESRLLLIIDKQKLIVYKSIEIKI